MKTRAVVALFALAMVLPVFALAHEGHAHHMTGTVTAIHADLNQIEIKDTAGKASSFYVTDATKYTQGTKTMSLGDLKPGMRVVADATMQGEKMIATSVRVGTAAAAAPHSHASPAPHAH